MDSTDNYKQLIVSLKLLSGQIRTESYPQNFNMDSVDYYQNLQIVNRLVCRILGFLDVLCNYNHDHKLKNHIYFAKSAWNLDSLAGAEYLLALYEGGSLKYLNPHYHPIKPSSVSKPHKSIIKRKSCKGETLNLNQ
jgi:hypothetical protein